MDRIEQCAKIINQTNIECKRVLDVGCRSKKLKTLLNGENKYIGIDLSEDDPEILQHDLEKKLPFNDNEFNYSSALDVIEHVENASQLLSELIRVSHNSVIVSFPNMYHWQFRLKYLLGKELNGKYSFYPKGSKDRHRWLTSYNNSLKFVRSNSPGCKIEAVPLTRRSRLFEWIDFLGAKLAPNLFSWGILLIITKENN